MPDSHLDIELINTAYNRGELSFHHLVDEYEIGVGIYGPNAAPLNCNSAAYTLLGMNKEQFLGNSAMDPYWKITHLNGSKFETYDFPIIKAITNYEPIIGVIMGVSRPTKNDKVWLEVNTHPILNNDGTVKHVICTYKEIIKPSV